MYLQCIKSYFIDKSFVFLFSKENFTNTVDSFEDRFLKCMLKGIKQGKRMKWRRKLCLYLRKWRSKNETEEAMAPAKQTCHVFHWCSISILNC